MSYLRFALMLAAVVLMPGAQAETISVSWDDDFFVDRDYGYTSGLRVAYVSDTHSDCAMSTSLTCATTDLMSGLPGVRPLSQHALLFALKQIMMTPRNVRRAEADFSDLPYVGYASVEAALFSWDQEQLVGYGVRLGVVGPDSGAGWVQRHVHRLTHDHYPAGWSNQLGQNLTGGVYATYLRRGPQWRMAQDRRLALAYGATVNAGSWQSYARVQGFVRYGRNLAPNFIPDYRSNGNDASLVGMATSGSGWELFLGLQGRYNAYEYVHKHADRYDVGLRHFSAGVMAGASWRFEHGPTLTLLLQHASSPLRKGGSRSFGTLALAWPF